MKRPVRPASEYEGHESYPSSEEAWLSRRVFLRTAAATVAVSAAGATVLGSEAGAAPGPGAKDKRHRVAIRLDRYTQIGQSGLRADQLIVYTGDKGLARFLRKTSDQRRVNQALTKRLRKVKPKTLYDGRKLYRLERSLGAIVTNVYRKRTGRGARQPDVMLNITRYYRYRRTGGVMISPSFRRRP